MRRLSFAIFLIAVVAAPALADVRIVSSSGGVVGISRVLFAGEAIGRPRHHRRAMPVSLHACTEHHSTQPHLRHIASGAGLSRPCDHRSGRTYVPVASGDEGGRGVLPPIGPGLDQTARRSHAEPHLSSRTGTRRTLSPLLIVELRKLGRHAYRVRTRAAHRHEDIDRPRAIELEREQKLLAGIERIVQT